MKITNKDIKFLTGNKLKRNDDSLLNPAYKRIRYTGFKAPQIKKGNRLTQYKSSLIRTPNFIPEEIKHFKILEPQKIHQIRRKNLDNIKQVQRDDFIDKYLKTPYLTWDELIIPGFYSPDNNVINIKKDQPFLRKMFILSHEVQHQKDWNNVPKKILDKLIKKNQDALAKLNINNIFGFSPIRKTVPEYRRDILEKRADKAGKKVINKFIQDYKLYKKLSQRQRKLL